MGRFNLEDMRYSLDQAKLAAPVLRRRNFELSPELRSFQWALQEHARSYAGIGVVMRGVSDSFRPVDLFSARSGLYDGGRFRQGRRNRIYDQLNQAVEQGVPLRDPVVDSRIVTLNGLTLSRDWFTGPQDFVEQGALTLKATQGSGESTHKLIIRKPDDVDNLGFSHTLLTKPHLDEVTSKRRIAQIIQDEAAAIQARTRVEQDAASQNYEASWVVGSLLLYACEKADIEPVRIVSPAVYGAVVAPDARNQFRKALDYPADRWAHLAN